MSMLLMVKAMNLKVGNPLRKLVLIKLADNANDSGECWPSYQYIADQCEVSRTSVKNHVRELEKSGLLTRIFRPGEEKGSSSNIFRLTFDNQGQHLTGGQHAPQGGQEVPEGGAGDARGGGAGAAPRTSHSIEPVIEPVNETDLAADAPDAFAKSKQSEEVQAVFDHWQRIMEKPKAKLDDKRKQLIRRSLKNYTADDLKKAIDGCRASDWHMGKNPSQAKYNELSLILRDSDKIDGFMERVGASRPRSAHTGFRPEDYQGVEYVSQGAEEWMKGGDNG